MRGTRKDARCATILAGILSRGGRPHRGKGTHHSCPPSGRGVERVNACCLQHSVRPGLYTHVTPPDHHHPLLTMPRTPARTPSSPSRLQSTTPPSSPPQKGVKRIVSGLKRRISHTFLRGHRHHASDSEAPLLSPSPRLSGASLVPDVPSDDEPTQPLPAPIEISTVEPHPIPIAISVSGQTADTLTRSIAAGGLGKHPTDFSDSDATTSSDDSSSFNAGRRRGTHRTDGSDSSDVPSAHLAFAHPVKTSPPPSLLHLFIHTPSTLARGLSP
ncbi:hypothetical protein GY45DRAFT_175256 [Cubamyces sp. BRFM 1775]|nr:hypothetical protein GY45DRAFT_175256 [Cubamyces sp. BRFM 1775]